MTHPPYLPFLLVWALPVIIGQWLIGRRKLWRWRAVWLPVVGILTIYFSLTDAVAIETRIWRLDRATLAGIWLGPVPLEEVLFFLLSSAMIAQGFVLLWNMEKRPKASGRDERDVTRTS